jgi:hypothetical protein
MTVFQTKVLFQLIYPVSLTIWLALLLGLLAWRGYIAKTSLFIYRVYIAQIDTKFPKLIYRSTYTYQNTLARNAKEIRHNSQIFTDFKYVQYILQTAIILTFQSTKNPMYYRVRIF